MTQQLEARFYQGDMVGWIHLYLTIGDQSQKIWLTSIFSPLEPFTFFLHDVLQGHLPAQLYIDEEGVGKMLQALPTSNPNLLYFRLTHPEKYNDHLDDVAEIFLAGLLHRGQFVFAIAHQLLHFLETEFNPKLWSPAPPEKLIDPLRRLMLEALVMQLQSP